ncbi:uncharacterized protein LOC123310981 [Coccinella septempunctata]|uniref:uncharacterized protein LOC123310981 n=1 Tax=Coccinella septempunctata TaxID=41139 RepID=UPI001D0904F3|nr:uncharacterized protein LOC123310981 [Coccinella septempunctata]
MASPSAALIDRLDKQGIPKSKRKLQKHLRSAGLAYISRTGKLIPAKKVADELCQCPQKCDERVPREARERLFYHFYGLGEADAQNQFLRQNMDLRARMNVPESTESGRPPRRITCKYLVPLLPSKDHVEVCQKAFVSAFVITTKRVRLQREKLISSLGLNSYSSHNRSAKNNQAATSPVETNNNNVKKITQMPSTPSSQEHTASSATIPSDEEEMADVEGGDDNEPKNFQMSFIQQLRGTQKRKIKQLVDNPLIPLGLFLPDGVTIAPVTVTPDHDRDIAIVNNFFSNQLWKPEYIGTYS